MTKKNKEVVDSEVRVIDLDSLSYVQEVRVIDLDSLSYVQLEKLAVDAKNRAAEKKQAELDKLQAEFEESPEFQKLKAKVAEFAKRQKALCKNASASYNVPIKLTLRLDTNGLYGLYGALQQDNVDIEDLFNFEVKGTVGKITGLSKEGKGLLETTLQESLGNACSDVLELFPGQQEVMQEFSNELTGFIEANKSTAAKYGISLADLE